MATVVVLLLSFLWSMVYCQTFPYIDAEDGPLDNNSYVEISSSYCSGLLSELYGARL